MNAIALDLNPIASLSPEAFAKLCAANPEARLERSAQGELIVMAPTGGETGHRNLELGADLVLWNRQTNLGKAFDSSTGFVLPNGATRSPDLAWIALERWQALSPETRRGFVPLCPDLAVELLSPSDSWTQTQGKMQEYMANGCRLGWLIDPQSRRVAVYRPQQKPEVLTQPPTLSGEEVLPGFELNLESLWGP
ncbi:MAG: Uma2 family endonuclease [Oscillatoriales cyanobacterium SM2_1_8]|nr:Uma2 family endonuclease [Oscillatoriales cyanobacterium SM2_1_8]